MSVIGLLGDHFNKCTVYCKSLSVRLHGDIPYSLSILRGKIFADFAEIWRPAKIFILQIFSLT